jgi:hydrogenase nickel incorporation protein HypB
MERIPVERKVLNENDRIAGELRTQFARHNVLCLNLISSPGSGKTALLERTLESFAPAERVAVLTGDIQTENDAKRLARFGFPVKQITTGGTCHLDARMIERALADWSLEDIDLLLIENVGNLVCPSSYDLGEKEKIVLLSVTEGEDKPLKYPSIFFKSNLLVLTKLDLLMHVPFQLAAAEENARRIHNEMEIVKVSCLTRDGVQSWLEWLSERRRRVRTAAMAAEHRTAESTKV